MALPYNIFNRIVKEVNAKPLGGGIYTVDCKTNLKLQLNIHGKPYTMTQEQLYVNYQDGMCVLAIDGEI